MEQILNTADQNLVELIKGFGIIYFIRKDLRDSDINLADYIKISEMNSGDVIFTHDGNSVVPFFIGNCTPYIQPTTNDGGIGWDKNNNMKKYKVLCVYGVSLNCGSTGEIIKEI